MSGFDWLSELVPERVRPLRRAEFELLAHEGLFDDERIELLRGAIVEMSPQDARHAAVTERLDRELKRVAPASMSVRVQMPFAASDDSLPEPDLAVVPRLDYDEGHPNRAYLVAEVAGSSLRKDRSIKRDLYARAGVPEYWVVNVSEQQVEIYTSPHDGQYAAAEIVRPGAVIRSEALGGVEIRVSEVLR